MKTFLALLVFTAVLPAAEPLRWQIRRVKEILPGCGDPKNGCAYAEYTSTELTSGSAPVRAEIREAMHGKQTPLEYVKHAVASFRQAKKEDPSGVIHWYDTTVERVLVSTPAIFSTKSASVHYYGGAHPNPTTIYHNFDPVTGAELSFDDFLKEDAYPHLEAIVKRRFEKDGSFDDAEFFLTDNFGFGGNGLFFTWNPYDLGARVHSGTIEIPYSEIRDLLKPGIAP